MAEYHEWDEIYDRIDRERKEAMNAMKSTTGFDDQFTTHPDDEEVELTDEDIPEDVGVAKDDPLTEDFPFEIKAIFWVLVVIVLGWLVGTIL